MQTKRTETKTDSVAVNAAREEVNRPQKIRSLPRFFGSGSWEGDLSQMRKDRPPRVPRRK
jgi:hypothetical protein